eukprot:850677-Prorocentrum_minimum.AAC.1
MVEYRSKGGDILLTGIMTDTGGIACDCKQCNGAVVSCSEFEKHAGSHEARPGENIYLSNGTSLRDFCNAVNTGITDGARALAATRAAAMPAGHRGNLTMPARKAMRGGAAGPLKPRGGATNAQVSPANLRTPHRTGDAKSEESPQRGGRRGYRGERKNRDSRERGLGGRRTNCNSSEQLCSRILGRHGRPGRIASRPDLNRSNNGTIGLGRLRRGCPVWRRRAVYTPGAEQTGCGQTVRDNNKHKHLFSAEGGLAEGTRVKYVTSQDETLLWGTVKGGGILCDCCSAVVSCSQFEVHAGRGSRRAPYDNIFTEAGQNLRRLAAQLLADQTAGDNPPGTPGCNTPSMAAGVVSPLGGTAALHLPGVAESMGLEEIVQRCRRLLSDLDCVAGGCVLCRCSDFLKDGFGARTIIICDQCEREFHIGCLQKFMGIALNAIPEGDWFCSCECTRIRS